MSQQHNATLIRRAAEAFRHGDLAEFSRHFAEDVVWHVPGRGPLAGSYRGVSSVLVLFGRAAGLAGSSLRIEPLDVMASARHAVLWQRLRGDRDGRELDVLEAIVFRIDGDRVAEAWERTDPEALDDFFSFGEVRRRRVAIEVGDRPEQAPAAADLDMSAVSNSR